MSDELKREIFIAYPQNQPKSGSQSVIMKILMMT